MNADQNPELKSLLEQIRRELDEKDYQIKLLTEFIKEESRPIDFKVFWMRKQWEESKKACKSNQ